MDPLLPSDPTQIDAYSLNGRLGSGGFGVVFAATDGEGTQVALKLLRPELSDDQRLRTRLGREADALRRVGGERNVEIFDVITEGDRAYLVMEFVEGETLAERVADQGPLVGPMLWFAAQGLVEALQAIHAAGIVHRDLKPSNVMYGPDGIKVLDFGISVAAEETGLTQTGAFLGTAAWISPEQILGRDVTEATDVFTLGMVLAFAATGRHPYGEGRADAVMYRITNTEPNLEGIPNPLREAVERCMSLDPAQRPTIGQLTDFFSSNGDESLPDAPTMGPVAGGTSIVQPDEMVARLGPRADDSKDESDPKVPVEFPDEGFEKSVAGSTSTVSNKGSVAAPASGRKRTNLVLAAAIVVAVGVVAIFLSSNRSSDQPQQMQVAGTTIATQSAPTTTLRLAPADVEEAVNPMPGAGVRVTAGRATWITGYVQAEIFTALLRELGYTVSESADMELHPQNAFMAIAEGDMDFWANSWMPGHQSWLNVEMSDGSLVGDAVTVLGEQMMASGLQGYLITKSFADRYGIWTLEDLDNNPKAIAEYDATDANPGNGLADIMGCPENWTCDDIINSQLKFGGYSRLRQVKAGYDSMWAQAVDLVNEGLPVVAYTWTPSAYITQIRPGDNAYWLGMEAILDSSNPLNMSGGEGWDQRPGAAAISEDHCPARNARGLCPIGWQSADIRAAANNDFLAANPAAEELFLQIKFSYIEISYLTMQQAYGADPKDLAAEWIGDNRSEVNVWLDAARAAG